MKKLLSFTISICVLIFMSGCSDFEYTSEMDYDEAEKIIYDIISENNYEIVKNDPYMLDDRDYRNYSLMLDDNLNVTISLHESKNHVNVIGYRITVKRRNNGEVLYVILKNIIIFKIIDALSLKTIDRDEITAMEEKCVEKYNKNFVEQGFDAEAASNHRSTGTIFTPYYTTCDYMISTDSSEIGNDTNDYSITQTITFCGSLK